MIEKNEAFFERYLQKYYDRRYASYDDIIEWYPNPAINIWRFYVPVLENEVILICSNEGLITEQVRYGVRSK